MPKVKNKKSPKKGAVRAELSALKVQIKALESLREQLSQGSAKRRKQSVLWTKALALLSESEES